MSKDKDKWLKSWKKRLGDYTEPAPADLWAELERELNSPRVIPFYRRYVAVAAVVSVVMLSGVAVWWLNTSSSDYAQQVSETIGAIVPSEDDKVSDSQEVQTVFHPDQIPNSVAARLAKAEPKETAMLAPLQEMPYDEEDVESTETPADESEQDVVVVGKDEHAVHRQGYTYDFSVVDSRKQSSRRQSQNRWTVGVSVGNSPIGTNSQDVGYRSLSQVRSRMQVMSNELLATSAYAQMMSYNLDNTVESRTKHKMPVTVGVSVRWHLNDRWAFESGLTYTKLSSELWSGSELDYYESEQKLHYVGIPLKASYELWENKFLAFYVSAGGAVEKCVSGEVNTIYTVDGLPQEQVKEDLSINELQWSVAAAVGAQVKLTSHIGLYVEPSLNYFFKDGSTVDTIRKEHPLNFNLQMGLRLTY